MFEVDFLLLDRDFEVLFFRRRGFIVRLHERVKIQYEWDRFCSNPNLGLYFPLFTHHTTSLIIYANRCNPSMPWKESSLKLGQSTHPNDPRYIWERSRGCGMARTGPGPDEELDDERIVPENQLLFVKGYKIAFSVEAWRRILAESIAVNTGQSMNGSTSDSEIDTGSGQTSGGSQAPSSGNALYNTSSCIIMNLDPFPAYDKVL